MNRQEAYDSLKRFANTSEAEGLKKPRSVLLLWFLKNVYGLDDLDAYEFVCDGDDDRGIDGLYLEPPVADDDRYMLTLFQSKYPEGPTPGGPKDIKDAVGSAVCFETPEGLEALLQGKVQPELLRLIQRYEIEKLLAEGKLDVRLVFVTAGFLNSDARAQVAATNHAHGEKYLTVYNVDFLGDVCEALETVKPIRETRDVECPDDLRFLTKAGSNRVAICSVKAQDVVDWPGIENRKLFDLNVRRELRRNRVRRELDRAIAKAADHKNFIAFHNGITVVCEKFEAKPGKLVIKNYSVVNGAQSVIAFHANRGSLTSDLRILAKFVEVGSQNPVAREVARRSNMQNPVNARNLRALDGRQLDIAAQFTKRYPDVHYETRPDTKNPAGAKSVIKNDDAAQLLCAIYTQKPWLAVKRLALFEDSYPEIFPPQIGADQIVLADLVRQRIETSKKRFPDEYRRAWSLTALVAVYLVGQLMRTEDDLEALLLDPGKPLKNRAKVESAIDELVRHVAGALRQRADRKRADGEFDDFKVEFKNESVLKKLRVQARDQYVYATSLEE